MTGLYVALGGAIGALLRWATVQLVAAPMGTLIVNVVGSFLIGVLFVALADAGPKWQPFLITGVLGGFTTFSAYSLDTMRLFEDGRVGAAAGYAIGSVVLSIFAAGLAIWFTRTVLS